MLIRLLRIIWLCLFLALPNLIAKAEEKTPKKSGLWVKISVDKEALYSISNAKLKEMGFADPSRVAVVGRSRAMINEYIDRDRDYMLAQRASHYDGKQLLFVAYSTDSWYYDGKDQMLRHIRNYYDQKSYYILTDAIADIKRMPKIDLPNNLAISSSKDEYIYPLLHENDLISLSESGRHFLGESFEATPNLKLEFPVDRRIEAVKLLGTWSALNKDNDIRLTMSIDGVDNSRISSTLNDLDFQKASWAGLYKLFGIYKDDLLSNWINYSTNKSFSINLNIDKPNKSSAYLDYVEANLLSKADFSAENMQYNVYYKDFISPSDKKYIKAKGLSNKLLIRENGQETSLVNAESISHSNDNYLPFSANNEHYFIADSKSLSTPKFEGRVDIVDLDAISDKLDLVIITSDALRSEAERLASFRRLNDALKVLVISQDEVFNLFSGATKDASSYRLLMKYFYDKALLQEPNKEPNISLLLFGDALFDNRKILSSSNSKEIQNTEFLLSYQSENFLDLDSYTSDDYFALMSKNIFPPTSDRKRELAIELEKYNIQIPIGRIVARNKSEAQSVVDKIIAYETDTNFSDWRIRSTFVADNGDNNSHTSQSNAVSKVLEDSNDEMIVNKLYMASYPRVNVGGKTTVPQAKKILLEQLNEGLLILNYNGHGSPISWADEQLLTLSDINTFAYKNLPLWITATCDFANFDANSTSAGEELLLKNKTGAIALLSTSRVVWDIPNMHLNKAVIKELFSKDNETNKLPRLGEVIRRAKNSVSNLSYPINRLNFALLGDPMQRLHYPKDFVEIKTLNNNDAKNKVYVKALEKVDIVAEIKTEGNKLRSDFNGFAYIRVYDSSREMKTIDNFSKNGNVEVSPFVYKDFSNIIYASKVKVVNGKIETSFIVPKDITYTNDVCKISIYAFDTDRKVDAIGVNLKMQVQEGKADNIEDTKVPEIRKISISHKDFVDGQRVADKSIFIAEVFDESSINLSNAGLGHSISLEIDDTHKIDLSRYYEASSLEYGLGTIAYILPPLEEGFHKLVFTVWDVAGNFTKKEVKIQIAYNEAPETLYMKLYPNPIKLSESHKLYLDMKYRSAGITPKIFVNIYDITGKLIAKIPANIDEIDIIYSSLKASIDLSHINISDGYYIVESELNAEHSTKSRYSSPLIVIGNK